MTGQKEISDCHSRKRNSKVDIQIGISWVRMPKPRDWETSNARIRISRVRTSKNDRSIVRNPIRKGGLHAKPAFPYRVFLVRSRVPGLPASRERDRKRHEEAVIPWNLTNIAYGSKLKQTDVGIF
jgi:hypothetical protein